MSGFIVDLCLQEPLHDIDVVLLVSGKRGSTVQVQLEPKPQNNGGNGIVVDPVQKSPRKRTGGSNQLSPRPMKWQALPMDVPPRHKRASLVLVVQGPSRPEYPLRLKVQLSPQWNKNPTKTRPVPSPGWKFPEGATLVPPCPMLPKSGCGRGREGS